MTYNNRFLTMFWELFQLLYNLKVDIEKRNVFNGTSKEIQIFWWKDC